METTLLKGNGFCALLHDGPMLLAICTATPYCHANVVVLEQDKGCRISLAVRCLSVSAKGHRIYDRSPGPPNPVSPIKSTVSAEIVA